MGSNADATGIQFRMLNKSKGPSVRSPRVQCDKKAYQFRMKAIVEAQPGLDVKQANASSLVMENGRIMGVQTDFGTTFYGDGSDYNGWNISTRSPPCGEKTNPGGRMADSSSGLSDNLRLLGFEVGRFKTGTPCRISRRSIDFSVCEVQDGDDPPPRFSFLPINSIGARLRFSL